MHSPGAIAFDRLVACAIGAPASGAFPVERCHKRITQYPAGDQVGDDLATDLERIGAALAQWTRPAPSNASRASGGRISAINTNTAAEAATA